MRIAYLINQYPKVSHTFIRREIAAVEALGADVLRFAIRPSADPLPDPADQKEMQRTRWLVRTAPLDIALALGAALGHPVRLLGALRLMFQIGRKSEAGLLKHLAYFVEAIILSRWCEADGIQHVHAHFATNAAAVAMLCHRLGGPTYSFTVHGPEDLDRAVVLGIDRKMAHASFVAAISDFTRSQLYRWCVPAEWPKIRVVRCGLEREDLQQAATAPSGKRFVCVGRLCVDKGHPILLEACAQLNREGVDFELTIVGGGPLQAALEEQIRDLELQDSVKMVGYQSGAEVRRLIQSACAMVLPSFAEGLPVVLMESLAMGRPVIATYIAGTPELVQDAVNGWLVPAGSVAALTTAMREALNTSPSRLLEMGERGMERVRQQHDQNREAAKLCEAFRQAIGAAADIEPTVASALPADPPEFALRP